MLTCSFSKRALAVKMVFSEYAKLRILHYHQLDYKPPSIERLLRGAKESFVAGGIHRLLVRYSCGTTDRRVGSGGQAKATRVVQETG